MAEDERGTHERWMTLLNALIKPLLQQHRGRLVKSTGDGVLAEFSSALHAVEWAQAVQNSTSKAGDPALGGLHHPIAFRAAVHLGDVIKTDTDIYGDGVNIAARLQEYAEPGGIVLSGAVYEVMRGQNDLEARDLGLLHLKNITKPVRAFEIPSKLSLLRVSARAGETLLPSIAVLPLQNLGSSTADQHLAEGIVEDIIVSLSALRELFVISRSSGLTYRKQTSDVQQIGRALGVRYVTTGSLRRSSKKVRIAIQLWDTQDGRSIWGDISEASPIELFDVQDRIVGKIVGGIAPHIRSTELRKSLRKTPENYSAYDCTLRALSIINSLDRETFTKAREHLERAMKLDPEFAMPAAWAARWHSLYVGQGWSENPHEDIARAVELASRAIDLDRQNALALATYGHLRSYLFHDCDTGLVYLDRALAACPNSAIAWSLSSATLSYIGRTEEAVRYAEQGLRLSPFDQSIFSFYMLYALALYANGAYEASVKWAKLSLSENPGFTSTLKILTAALVGLDRLDEAREIAGKLLKLSPGFRISEFERTLQPFRQPEIKTRYLEHLGRSGLPV